MSQMFHRGGAIPGYRFSASVILISLTTRDRRMMSKPKYESLDLVNNLARDLDCSDIKQIFELVDCREYAMPVGRLVTHKGFVFRGNCLDH